MEGVICFKWVKSRVAIEKLGRRPAISRGCPEHTLVRNPVVSENSNEPNQLNIVATARGADVFGAKAKLGVSDR